MKFYFLLNIKHQNKRDEVFLIFFYIVRKMLLCPKFLANFSLATEKPVKEEVIRKAEYL